MTREQIDALSDDPDELRRQLIDIAGPDAKILIDSFEGRDLPPKALIKSIRVTRDQFAPEVHFAGEVRIEILTQPGIGPVRGNLRSGYYDSVFDGENPLHRTDTAVAELAVRHRPQRHAHQRTRILQRQLQRPGQLLDAGAGCRNTARRGLRQASRSRARPTTTSINGGIDYALTRDQVLRLNFQGSKFNRGNVGIGAYDLPERAYTTEDTQFGLFLQQNGPIGRRFVLNTRLSIFGNDSVARSAVEAETFIVNDSFTSGGAQRSGGQHARNYWFNSDLDYVRGIHSMRAGIEVQASRYNTDSNSNYLGTYVFESLDAFEARTPRSYSRRLGDPQLKYSNVQGGAYIQDDIKIRKNFTLTGGVRYEAQTHVPDKLNFAPRVGFTWAPRKTGKTTLRGSWGMFYDWLATGTYLQTLQVDGVRQRELNIVDPSFPDPGDVGASPPTNRYLLADRRDMAYSQRLSAGIAQTITRRFNTNVLYTYSYRYALLTGRNLNTPIDGERPDPDFANVVLATSDAFGRQHTVNASMNLNLGPLPPTGGPAGGPGGGMMMMNGGGGPVMIMMGGGPGGAAATGPRFVWNRGLSMSGFYTYGQNFDNSDGAFVIPSSIFLAQEWGPTAFDRRHNTHIAVTSTAAEEPRHSVWRVRFVGAAADHSHGHRRQRRSGLQRSS